MTVSSVYSNVYLPPIHLGLFYGIGLYSASVQDLCFGSDSVSGETTVRGHYLEAIVYA